MNSSNVVLMDVKSGRVIGDLNGEERIYPASMTKIMTAIVALEAFSDLDGEITLSDDNFFMHWMDRTLHRLGSGQGKV